MKEATTTAYEKKKTLRRNEQHEKRISIVVAVVAVTKIEFE